MSTGQTMMTIFAFVLLTTTLNSFYRLLASTGNDISSSQDGILASTIATSYMEIAQGKAFDERSDTSDAGINNITQFTLPASLGPEASDGDSIHEFNDFDDFDGLVVEETAGTTGRKYKTSFVVNYVTITNVSQISAARTFVKRMDMKTWRTSPPIAKPDTLRQSLVLGYFHFD
jgi:hypothetical protein